MIKAGGILGVFLVASTVVVAEDSVAPVTGISVSPANQLDLGVSLSVNEFGCDREGQLYVEATYPAQFNGEAARIARFRLDGGASGIELYLEQRLIKPDTLYIDFCAGIDALRQAEVMVVYGGAGTEANIQINQMDRWIEPESEARVR
jgi:hypothetical protein